MNNYHTKQKENNSTKSSIKRFNALLEYDSNINVGYFYIPPNTSKEPIKVKYFEQVVTKFGTYVFDFDENHHIIGFEILDTKNLDLKSLGINE